MNELHTDGDTGMMAQSAEALLLHALAQSDEQLDVALVGKLAVSIGALATLASTNEAPEVRAIGLLLDGLKIEADVMRELLRRRAAKLAADA